MASTADGLEALDEAAVARLEGRFECIDGRFVEKGPMGAQANELAFLLMWHLMTHVRAHRLGRCFGENCVYRIFEDPRRSRIPDGSFIRAGRLPDDRSPRGDIRIAPDLALEVVSPNDVVENLNERIGDLLRAGTRLLWVIVPGTRNAYVYRADGTVSLISEGDALDGEDVVPGFTYRLGDLFDGLS